MPVKLTKSALGELQSLVKSVIGDDQRRVIPSLGWHLSAGELDASGKITNERGPGFSVGFFYAEAEHTGWDLVNQDGVEFLLLLPPNFDKKDDILIDYFGGEFLIA